MHYRKYMVAGAVVSSAISSLGTIPYGFRFANVFVKNNSLWFIIVGCILATAAVLANMILGTYSLLQIEKEKELLYVMPISLISSLPFGFICFFGYKGILPNSITIPISFMVFFVNAGIGYTAIINLIHDVKDLINKYQSLFLGDVLFNIIGFFIGLIVSAISFVAAADGLNNLFLFYQWPVDKARLIAYIVAFLAWVPFAALFSNSTRVIAVRAYYFLSQFKKFIKLISIYDVVLIVLAMLSGCSIGQMALDFFEPARHIPSIMKTTYIQAWIYPVLMPLSVFSSASVNYFALNNVFYRIKKKK